MYCSTIHTHAKKKNRQTPEGFACFLVGEDGFEPSKRNVTDLQSAPFGLSGTPPFLFYNFVPFILLLPN